MLSKKVTEAVIVGGAVGSVQLLKSIVLETITEA